jgi:hypothetical protein
MRNYGQLVAPQQVLIECIITPQGGQSIAQNPFNEQEYLVGRPIIGLQVFCASDMVNSPLSAHLPVIPDALMPFAFLNIQRAGNGPVKSGVWYKWLPLVYLRNLYNPNGQVSGCLDQWRCDPMTIQWRDTNIAFPTSTAQGNTYSVPILVTFLMPQQDADQYRMAFIKGQVPHKIHGYDDGY